MEWNIYSCIIVFYIYSCIIVFYIYLFANALSIANKSKDKKPARCRYRTGTKSFWCRSVPVSRRNCCIQKNSNLYFVFSDSELLLHSYFCSVKLLSDIYSFNPFQLPAINSITNINNNKILLNATKLNVRNKIKKC